MKILSIFVAFLENTNFMQPKFCVYLWILQTELLILLFVDKMVDKTLVK